MIARRIRQGLFAAVLLGGAVWNASDAIAAEQLVFVRGYTTNASCGSPAGYYYFVEGWGMDVFGNVACEASAISGVNGTNLAQGSCGANATTVVAAITLRNYSAAFQYVSTVVQTGATTAWNQATVVMANIPSSSSCSGGAQITAVAGGLNTTSTPPQVTYP
jgi:hypothetical protein